MDWWARCILRATVCCIALLANLAFAEIYKEVDEKGALRYSDRKMPGANQQVVTLESYSSSWKQFEIEIIDEDNVLTNAEIARVKRDVNAVYQFYDQTLYFDIYKTVPVKIRLFRTSDGYNNYLAKQFNSPRSKSRGMYYPASNEIFVWLNPVRWRTFWTIKHEVSHAIVDTLTPYVPAWLNEGLAENMESIGMKDHKFFLYRHDENFRAISRRRDTEGVTNIKQFLSYTSVMWRKKSSNAHAGEFVRMLLSSTTGKSFVVRLVHIFERGNTTLSHIHADKHYIGGLNALQYDWRLWINRERSKRFAL